MKETETKGSGHSQCKAGGSVLLSLQKLLRQLPGEAPVKPTQ